MFKSFKKSLDFLDVPHQMLGSVMMSVCNVGLTIKGTK